MTRSVRKHAYTCGVFDSPYAGDGDCTCGADAYNEGYKAAVQVVLRSGASEIHHRDCDSLDRDRGGPCDCGVPELLSPPTQRRAGCQCEECVFVDDVPPRRTPS